jgi:hypothetical protein
MWALHESGEKKQSDWSQNADVGDWLLVACCEPENEANP